MRKLALLAALMIVAAVPTTSNAAAKKADPAIQAQADSFHFIRDSLNPYEATMPKPAMKHKRHAKHKM